MINKDIQLNKVNYLNDNAEGYCLLIYIIKLLVDL